MLRGFGGCGIGGGWAEGVDFDGFVVAGSIADNGGAAGGGVDGVGSASSLVSIVGLGAGEVGGKVGVVVALVLGVVDRGLDVIGWVGRSVLEGEVGVIGGGRYGGR